MPRRRPAEAGEVPRVERHLVLATIVDVRPKQSIAVPPRNSHASRASIVKRNRDACTPGKNLDDLRLENLAEDDGGLITAGARDRLTQEPLDRGSGMVALNDPRLHLEGVLEPVATRADAAAEVEVDVATHSEHLTLVPDRLEHRVLVGLLGQQAVEPGMREPATDCLAALVVFNGEDARTIRVQHRHGDGLRVLRIDRHKRDIGDALNTNRATLPNNRVLVRRPQRTEIDELAVLEPHAQQVDRPVEKVLCSSNTREVVTGDRAVVRSRTSRAPHRQTN